MVKGTTKRALKPENWLTEALRKNSLIQLNLSNHGHMWLVVSGVSEESLKEYPGCI